MPDQPTSKRKSGPGRVPASVMKKAALQMRAKGESVAEIAKALQRSERYIYKLLAEANNDGTARIIVVPDPIQASDLPPDVAAGLVFDADGFEAFFNRYSGRTLQPIHKQWVNDVLSTTRTLINCPPRHAKSTIFSVWFPIWLLSIDRNEQILICSQTEKLAKKFTNEIAYHLAYNQQLISDLGRFRPETADWPWRPNSGELLVDGRSREYKSGDLSIQVRGAGQQILGMEASWVIVDDAVSRKHTKSVTERETLSEWFHGDVMSRLEPGGKAICIGQRLHLYDLYGELRDEKIRAADGSERPRWNHLNYPAVLRWPDEDPDFPEPEVLWPAKWHFEALMETYADLGASLFTAMYQQEPLPEGEALARRAWLYGDDNHPGCTDLTRPSGVGREGPERRVRVVSLDPSPTRYAGLIVADVIVGDIFECDVLEIVREKMSVRDMLSHIERVIDYYAPSYFIFEQNAAQRWLLQDPAMDRLRKRIRVLPHVTNRNKGDATLGVESLAVDFEFGRIRVPYADAEGRSMSEMLFKEALEYPQGETDDLLMALWFIRFNYSRLAPRSSEGFSNRHTRHGGFRVPNRLQSGWGWNSTPQPPRPDIRVTVPSIEEK